MKLLAAVQTCATLSCPPIARQENGSKQPEVSQKSCFAIGATTGIRTGNCLLNGHRVFFRDKRLEKAAFKLPTAKRATTATMKLQLVPHPGSAGILAGKNRRECQENH